MKRLILFCTMLVVLCFGFSQATFADSSVVATFDGGVVTNDEIVWLRSFFRNDIGPVIRGVSSNEEGMSRVAQMVVLDRIAGREFVASGKPYPRRIELEVQLRMRGVLSQQYATAVMLKRVSVSDEEVKEYYEENEESFHTEFKFSIRNIFMDTRSCKTEEEKQAILEKMKVLYAKLEEGVPFRSLIREFSDAQYDIRTDLRGPFKKGQVNPLLEQAAMKLNVGMYSEIIELTHGYQIILLERKQEAQNIGLEDAKDGIITRLKKKKGRELRPLLIEELSKEMGVEQPDFSSFGADALSTKTLYKIGDFAYTGEYLVVDLETGKRGSRRDLIAKRIQSALNKSFGRDVLAEKAISEGYDQTDDFKAKYELVENHLLRGYASGVQKTEMKIEVTDEEVRQVIKKYPKRHQTKPVYKAREIMIKVEISEDIKTSLEYQENLEKAETFLKDIRKKVEAGESFAKLAKKHSDAPTAQDGGDLGWVTEAQKGRIFGQCLETIEKKEAGAMSDPMFHRAKREYTMILIEDVKPPVPLPEEEVLPRVKRALVGQKRAKLRRERRAKLLKDKHFEFVYSDEEPASESGKSIEN